MAPTESTRPFLDLRVGGLRITMHHRPRSLVLYVGHLAAIAATVLAGLHH